MSFRDFPIWQCCEVPSQAAPVRVTILGDLSSSPQVPKLHLHFVLLFTACLGQLLFFLGHPVLTPRQVLTTLASLKLTAKAPENSWDWNMQTFLFGGKQKAYLSYRGRLVVSSRETKKKKKTNGWNLKIFPKGKGETSTKTTNFCCLQPWVFYYNSSSCRVNYRFCPWVFKQRLHCRLSAAGSRHSLARAVPLSTRMGEEFLEGSSHFKWLGSTPISMPFSWPFGVQSNPILLGTYDHNGY